MNNLNNKIRKHFEGLRRAQEYITSLKSSNYPNKKESLKNYNSLWLFWQLIRKRRYSKELDRLHQKFLIQRRNIFDKVSSVFKYD